MRVRPTSAALALASIVCGVLAWSAPAQATVTYNPSSAVADGDPNSLRDVIDQANVAGDDVVINLDGGSYVLDVCGVSNENNNVSGDLNYLSVSALRIVGNGSTIEQTCAGERIFESLTNAPISAGDTTFTGGDLVSPGNGGGGAVFALGDATLSDVRFEDNRITATPGFGIAGVAAFSNGMLTLDSVVASGHQGATDDLALGGVFYGDLGLHANQVEVDDTTISGSAFDAVVLGGVFSSANDVELVDVEVRRTAIELPLGGGGTAGAVVNSESGQITVTDGLIDQTSVIGAQGLRVIGLVQGFGGGRIDGLAVTDTVVTGGSDSTALGAGAINLSGTSEISATSVEGVDISLGDQSIVAGGGVLVDFAALTDVLVADIDVTVGSGAGGPSGGTGVGIAGEELTLEHVMVVDTSMNGGDQALGVGGGIYAGLEVEAADVTSARNRLSLGADSIAVGAGFVGGENGSQLRNVTISDNVVEAGPSTDAIGGGGLVLFGASQLSYVTIADNAVPDFGLGANVYFVEPGDLFATVVSGGMGADNCAFETGVGTSAYSYDTDGSCQFSGTGDVSAGGDPLLEALADNGNDLLTRLPAAGSPLLDRFTPADDARCEGVDERGVTRPQGGACDVGAVEREVALPPIPLEPLAPLAPAAPPAPVGAVPRFTG